MVEKGTIFSERFEDLLRTYYFVGGMPEAVSLFSQNSDFVQVCRVQEDILSAYRRDFAKHAGNVVGKRCRMVFESLPRHLAKENKKFIYGVAKKGFRGRELDDALQFLQDAGLVIKVPRISAPGIPLSAYADEGSFKLFCLNVGLLGALAGVESQTILEGNSLFTHVPIEVKAEENLKAKSLASFCKTHGLTNAVRFSLSGYREESWMTNVPLYAAHCLAALRS